MKTKFVILLTVLGFFSCRKDELIISEYIDVKVDQNDEMSMQIKDPQLILDGNLFKFNTENNTVIEIDLGSNEPKLGLNQPVRLSLPFGFCDDKTLPCKGNISMTLTSLGQVDEIVKGEITGKLYIDNQWQDIRMSFNVSLNDEYQTVSGRIWYDTNKNNILDLNENGINGLMIQSKANGIKLDKKASGKKPFSASVDGYFELKASTKYANDIIIDLPLIGLVFVDKNIGSNSLINSHFDPNGQINGLVVNKGDKIVINAGLRPE
jgi:hypothetical protein